MDDSETITALPFPITCRDAEVNFNLRMSVTQMVAQYTQVMPVLLPPVPAIIASAMQVLGLLSIEDNTTKDWSANELDGPFTFFEPHIGEVLLSACLVNIELFEHVLEHADADEIESLQAVGSWYGTAGNMFDLIRQTKDVLVGYKNYIEGMGVTFDGD